MKIYLSRKFCKVSHCSFETVQLNKAIITYWEKFESFHSTTPKESFKLFCNGNLFAEATGIIGRISTVEFLFTKRSFLYILSYYLITWYKCIFFRLSGLAYLPIFCTKNLKKKISVKQLDHYWNLKVWNNDEFFKSTFFLFSILW